MAANVVVVVFMVVSVSSFRGGEPSSATEETTRLLRQCVDRGRFV
jgi:hypothetical protein